MALSACSTVGVRTEAIANQQSIARYDAHFASIRERIMANSQDTEHRDNRELFGNLLRINRFIPDNKGMEIHDFIVENINMEVYQMEVQEFVFNHMTSFEGFIQAMIGEGDASDAFFYLNNSDVTEMDYLLEGANFIVTRRDINSNNQRIVFSAHYDTVYNTPGAVDNASGTIALINLINYFEDKDLGYDLEFVFFGFEEVGLVGSRFYNSILTDEEIDNILININIDCIGLEDGGDFLFASSDGSNPFEGIIDSFDDHEFLAITASDHFSFEMNGIRNVLLCQPFDAILPVIHTPMDNINRIDFRLFSDSVDQVIELVYEITGS